MNLAMPLAHELRRNQLLMGQAGIGDGHEDYILWIGPCS
jgi:hypothetical protein